MRPSVKLLAAPLVVAALVGTACARPGAVGQGIDHPTGPHELILRIDVGGGLLPPRVSLREAPAFSLLGDGRIVVPGPQIEIYPGPALPNLQVRTVSEEGVQAILAAAQKAGLLGPDRRYDDGRTADASTTTFTVVAGGGRHVVSVYALGLESPDESYPSDRSTLAAFYGKLTGLESWLPAGSLGLEEPFRTDEMRVYVLPYQPEDLSQKAMAWPAGGFAGFRPVPEFTDLRCGMVSGSALPAVLSAAASANELTPWRAEGRLWSVVFRPLLPDESGCQ